MAINKVVYDGDTLVDLTSDTVTPETLSEGVTAHNAAGEQIVGTMTGGGSDEEWIGDGNTHVWVHIDKNCMTPVVGVCPKGTVTVDWGDGTAPDVLTGTSTSTVKWAPTHYYESVGDYIITLTVDGTVGLYGTVTGTEGAALFRYSSSKDGRNYYYRNAVKKVEIGNGVTVASNYAFANYYGLESINISDSVISIGSNVFSDCYNLKSIDFPSGTTFTGGTVLQNCCTLKSARLPDALTSIGTSLVLNCYNLTSIDIPAGVTSIGNSAFSGCRCLASIDIPTGVTSIGNSAFSNNSSLSRVRFNSTTPPTVSNSNAFNNLSTHCIISVPTGTLTAYTSATNYPDPATYTYIEED